MSKCEVNISKGILKNYSIDFNKVDTEEERGNVIGSFLQFLRGEFEADEENNIGSVDFIAKMFTVATILELPRYSRSKLSRETSENSKVLDSYIEQIKDNQADYADNIDKLKTTFRVSSIDEVISVLGKVIKKRSIVHSVSVGTSSTVLGNEVTYADDSIISYNTLGEGLVAKSLSIGTGEGALLKMKSDRIAMVSNIKKDSIDNWLSVLETYFPGENKIGADFTEWAREKFLDVFLDTTGGGFVNNIDAKINEIKEELVIKRGLLKGHMYEETDELFAKQLLDDTNAKTHRARYFNDVLLTDFDFILESLIKLVSVDVYASRKANATVEGLVIEGVYQDELILNLSATIKREVFKRVPGSDILTLQEGFETELEVLSTDTVGFKSNIEHKPGAFYHLTGDNTFYYRTKAGLNIDVTPKKVYSFNNGSNRNSSSIDHDVLSLDNSTEFLRNVLPVFKLVAPDGTLGSRMSIGDFMAIAPILVSSGGSISDIRETLQRLEKSEHARTSTIARTLNTYMFSKYPKNVKGGTITSIYSVASSKYGGEINKDITTSLMSALRSVAHLQRLKLDEGRTTLTRGANEGSESQIIDNELATYLVDRNTGKTKKSIAGKLSISFKKINGIILNPGEEPTPLEQITTVEGSFGKVGMRKVAMKLGLDVLLDRIDSIYKDIYSTSDLDKMVVGTFKSIIETAAYNVDDVNYLIPSESVKKAINVIEGKKDYYRVPPSTIIKDQEQKNLADVFFVDSSKAQRFGANKTMQTSSTPNKNTTAVKQVDSVITANNNINKQDGIDLSHMPFVREDHEAEHESGIPGAKLLGISLKPPIIHDGRAVDTSEWDIKVRVDYAMIQGFLAGPKEVGKEFFLQAINYSDKSTPELMHIETSENLLKSGSATQKKLVLSFIEYQASKNEQLQKTTLNSFREFIVGNFESLRSSIIEESKEVGESEEALNERLTALSDLQVKLATNPYSEGTGNMIRPVNDILEKVKLNPSLIEFSKANLDKGADYLTFKGAKNTTLLKPNAGARAAVFRDPKKGNKIVKEYLKRNRALLNSRTPIGMDTFTADKEKIESLLSLNNRVKGAGIITTANEFYDRFFLINAIYGHSLKTITMGDESYFSGKYDAKTIGEFNEKADRDFESSEIQDLLDSGMDGIASMMTGQSKRAQSILTRGVVYAHKDTLVGLKRKYNRKNLLQHLEIYQKSSTRPNDVYRFKELEGKTLSELYGLGIINPVVEGTNILSYKKGKDTFVSINIGNDTFVVPINNLKSVRGLPADLALGIDYLFNVALNKSDSSSLNILSDEIPAEAVLLESTVEVNSHENAITLNEILEFNSRIISENDGVITRPDFVPSLLMSDPVSYVNVLEKMNIQQENSDAIQMIHPLLHLIFEHMRGNSVGAFNTESYNAGKWLTTTVEYDKARQSLQKSSTQMPFSYSQMKKLGSMEVFNLFKKLNTSIDFKQSTFKYQRPVRIKGKIQYNPNGSPVLELDTKLANTEIRNLDDLFTYFGGYGAKGDAAWVDVLEVLRQNPADLYSFVGFVNVPSNQKTGQKNTNKYEDLFSKKFNPPKYTETPGYPGFSFPETDDVNMGYTGSEFAYEVLTKEHDYDVSGNYKSRATLTLLSQLVNAVSFGGLSDISIKNLHNSLNGRMLFNKLQVGNELAAIAVDAKKEALEDDIINPALYDDIIRRLESGDISTKEYTDEQILLYEDIMRKGFFSATMLAFNEKIDSITMKRIIEGEGYSLDTPYVMNKVMGSIRAAFFSETIKMKMSGFQAVVSTTYKTINIHSLGDSRLSRVGYIKKALSTPSIDWSAEAGKIVDILDEDIEGLKELVLPYDMVKVTDAEGKETFPTFDEIVKNRRIYFNPRRALTITAVILPDSMDILNYVTTQLVTPDTMFVVKGEDQDTLYTRDQLLEEYPKNYMVQELIDAGKLDIDPVSTYDNLSENTIVRVKVGLNSYESYYKWYLEESFTGDLERLIREGKVVEDKTEKYGLRWYDIKKVDKDADEQNIKDTADYRNYYRAMVSDEDVSEEDINGLRAKLIKQTQRKDEDGNPVWDMIPAEVVLPNFMRERFKLPDGVDLHDLIGTSSDRADQKKSLKHNLKKFVKRDSRFRNITNKKHFAKMITRLYASQAVKNPSPWMSEIADYLINVEGPRVEAAVAASGGKKNEHDILLSPEAIAEINRIKNEAFEKHIDALSQSFLDMLEVVLTRIPGQSKQSGFVATVVEFLDSQGNASFAPTDHLVTTGGDYDIDTLSVLTKTMDLDGIVPDKNEYKLDGVFNYDLLVEDYNKQINDVQTIVRDFVTKSNVEAESYVTKLTADLDAEKDPTKKKALEKRISYAKKNKIDDASEVISRRIKNINARFSAILSNHTSISIMEALGNVDAAVEINTPISMSLLQSIKRNIEREEESSKKPSTAKTFDVNGESFWPIIMLEELAAQGNKSVGVFATTLKINSAIQASKLYFDEYYANRSGLSGNDNPFKFNHKIYFVKNGKKEVRTRESFSDLDRYKVSNMMRESRVLQDAMDAMDTDSENYDNNSAGLLINILENELSSSIDDSIGRKEKERFTVAQKAALLEEFGVDSFDEIFIDSLKEMITDTESATTIFYTKFKNATGIDLYTSPIKAVNMLEDSKLNLKSENAAIVLNMLKDKFGLVVPSEIITDTKTPVAELKKYLELNPDKIEKAFLHIIGKQMSNDVQSQYLSAATDNAKELILGKIRSNTLTNPIITTMMVLGYDINDIIDFLYDPTVTSILLEAAVLRSSLKKVTLTSDSVSKSSVLGNSQVKSSLISILDVSKEIAKFRSVRNLAEDSKIEQSILDNILDSFDSDNLVEAIEKDNINHITIDPEEDVKQIFNPDLMVFLHPQSKALVTAIYDSENYIMKSLFRTVDELRAFTDIYSRDELSYKNIKSYYAALKVEDYLKTAKIVENEDGTTSEQRHLGLIKEYNEDGSFKPGVKRVFLDDPASREEFVDNFQVYLDYVRTRVKDNAGIDNIGNTSIYGSNKSVLAFPVLKGSNVDPAKRSVIMDGIKKLKAPESIPKPTNPTEESLAEYEKKVKENEFLREVYQNFALYALIVSRGEFKTGSMIDMFDNIIFELAEHLNTLSPEYYRDNFRIESPIIRSIVTGNVQTDTSLEVEYAKRSRSRADEQGYYDERDDDMDDTRDYDEGGQDQGYDDMYADEMGNMGIRTQYESVTALSTAANTEILGEPHTVGNVFRKIDKDLGDALFYAYAKNETAYRIFDIVDGAALPQTSSKSFQQIGDIDFINELAHAGKQLGYKIKYNGEDAWVLAFEGYKSSEVDPLVSYGEYLVYIKGKEGIFKIPGGVIMDENADLLLRGNIIEPVTSSNLARYEFYKEIDDRLIKDGYTPQDASKHKEYKVAVTQNIKDLFTGPELISDPIINQEAVLLSNSAADTLKVDKDLLGFNTAYARLAGSSEISTASHRSGRIFIPSIVYKKGEFSTSTETQVALPDVVEQLTDRINFLEVGESVNFYGIKNTGQLKADPSQNLKGGIDILEEALAGFIDKKGETDKGTTVTTAINGGFEITARVDKITNGVIYTVKRIKNNIYIESFDSKNTAYFLTKDTNKNIVSDGSLSLAEKRRLTYKAIEKGYKDFPHSMLEAVVNGTSRKILVFDSTAKSSRKHDLVIREGNEYYEFRVNKKLKGKETSTRGNIRYVAPDVIAGIEARIKKGDVKYTRSTHAQSVVYNTKINSATVSKTGVKARVKASSVRLNKSTFDTVLDKESSAKAFKALSDIEKLASYILTNNYMLPLDDAGVSALGINSPSNKLIKEVEASGMNLYKGIAEIYFRNNPNKMLSNASSNDLLVISGDLNNSVQPTEAGDVLRITENDMFVFRNLMEAEFDALPKGEQENTVDQKKLLDEGIEFLVISALYRGYNVVFQGEVDEKIIERAFKRFATLNKVTNEPKVTTVLKSSNRRGGIINNDTAPVIPSKRKEYTEVKLNTGITINTSLSLLNSMMTKSERKTFDAYKKVNINSKKFIVSRLAKIFNRTMKAAGGENFDIQVLSSREIEEEYGAAFSSKKGFIIGGQIVINAELADASTVFHEFGHFYMNWLKGTSNETYTNMLSFVESRYQDKILDYKSIYDKTGIKYTHQEILEEIFVDQVGMIGAADVANIVGTSVESADGYIEEYLDTFLKKLTRNELITATEADFNELSTVADIFNISMEFSEHKTSPVYDPETDAENLAHFKNFFIEAPTSRDIYNGLVSRGLIRKVSGESDKILLYNVKGEIVDKNGKVDPKASYKLSEISAADSMLDSMEGYLDSMKHVAKVQFSAMPSGTSHIVIKDLITANSANVKLSKDEKNYELHENGAVTLLDRTTSYIEGSFTSGLVDQEDFIMRKIYSDEIEYYKNSLVSDADPRDSFQIEEDAKIHAINFIDRKDAHYQMQAAKYREIFDFKTAEGDFLHKLSEFFMRSIQYTNEIDYKSKREGGYLHFAKSIKKNMVQKDAAGLRKYITDNIISRIQDQNSEKSYKEYITIFEELLTQMDGKYSGNIDAYLTLMMDKVYPVLNKLEGPLTLIPEVQLASKKMGVAGKLDLLVIDGNGVAHIFDYKNKEVAKTNFWDYNSPVKMKGTLSDYSNNAMMKASAQTSIYKLMLNEMGIKTGPANVFYVESTLDRSNKKEFENKETLSYRPERIIKAGLHDVTAEIAEHMIKEGKDLDFMNIEDKSSAINTIIYRASGDKNIDMPNDIQAAAERYYDTAAKKNEKGKDKKLNEFLAKFAKKNKVIGDVASMVVSMPGGSKLKIPLGTSREDGVAMIVKALESRTAVKNMESEFINLFNNKEREKFGESLGMSDPNRDEIYRALLVDADGSSHELSKLSSNSNYGNTGSGIVFLKNKVTKGTRVVMLHHDDPKKLSFGNGNNSIFGNFVSDNKANMVSRRGPMAATAHNMRLVKLGLVMAQEKLTNPDFNVEVILANHPVHSNKKSIPKVYDISLTLKLAKDMLEVMKANGETLPPEMQKLLDTPRVFDAATYIENPVDALTNYLSIATGSLIREQDYFQKNKLEDRKKRLRELLDAKSGLHNTPELLEALRDFRASLHLTRTRNMEDKIADDLWRLTDEVILFLNDFNYLISPKNTNMVDNYLITPTSSSNTYQSYFTNSVTKSKTVIREDYMEYSTKHNKLLQELAESRGISLSNLGSALYTSSRKKIFNNLFAYDNLDADNRKDAFKLRDPNNPNKITKEGQTPLNAAEIKYLRFFREMAQKHGDLSVHDSSVKIPYGWMPMMSKSKLSRRSDLSAFERAQLAFAKGKKTLAPDGSVEKEAKTMEDAFAIDSRFKGQLPNDSSEESDNYTYSRRTWLGIDETGEVVDDAMPLESIEDNLENVLDTFVMASLEAYHYREVSEFGKAMFYNIKRQERLSGSSYDDLIETLILSQRMVVKGEKKESNAAINFTNKIATSAVTMGTVSQALLETFTNPAITGATYLSDKLYGTLFKGQREFSMKSFSKAFAMVTTDYGEDKAVIEALDNMYGITNMDNKNLKEMLNSLEENSLFQSKKLMFVNKIMLESWQKITMVAYMLEQGTFHAHSIDEYGDLVYDESKDKRFSNFGDEIKIKADKKAKYNAVKEELSKQRNGLTGTSNESFEDRKLRRAWTNYDVNYVKGFITEAYSSMDDSSKSLASAYAITGAFAKMRTWLFPKIPRYFKTPMEAGKNMAGASLVKVKDDSELGYRYEWKGSYSEGILYTVEYLMRGLAEAKFNVFSKDIYKDMHESQKKNMSKLLGDVLLFTLLNLAAKGVWSMADDDLKKNEFAKLVYQRVIMASSDVFLLKSLLDVTTGNGSLFIGGAIAMNAAKSLVSATVISTESLYDSEVGITEVSDAYNDLFKSVFGVYKSMLTIKDAVEDE